MATSSNADRATFEDAFENYIKARNSVTVTPPADIVGNTRAARGVIALANGLTEALFNTSRYLRLDPRERAVPADVAEALFGACLYVKSSRDALPGWIVDEIEGLTTEGRRPPVTYGAAAKLIMERLKDAGHLAFNEMTPEEIKQARQSLGLTQADLAVLLDTDPQTVRRMELAEDASTFRKPAPRMVRLIRAYLEGHRPADWPQ